MEQYWMYQAVVVVEHSGGIVPFVFPMSFGKSMNDEELRKIASAVVFRRAKELRLSNVSVCSIAVKAMPDPRVT